MNRNAFTLIEVLVSVTILAVVATGLFQIALNSKNNFTFLEQKAQFDRMSSIPIMHNDPKYHHSEKPLYEFLRTEYEITEDQVRQYLKKEKVAYSQEEYAKFSPFSQEENSDEEISPFEEDETAPAIATDLTLTFEKITIHNKHHSTYVYKIEMK
jgi:prepilin-type N-terminal cleavage/methylation domain-containing protein